MTDLPRATTSPELAKLRSDHQSCELFLIVYSPPTVYSARLAAVPTSTDQVVSITHNTNSGTLSDIKEDMSLYVGTTAGAYDLGLARMRKDGLTGIVADAALFNIGEESEIDWSHGGTIYLTVVDDFLLWPRHIKIASDGTTPLMDVNVAYTNQNQTAGYYPFAVMGPHRVKWLRGATVVTAWDGSNSWIINQSIASYLWAFPGASATSGLTTATPTATYDTPGIYRASLQVTGDNGISDIGYRYVFVIDPNNLPSWLITQFKLNACGGTKQSGNYSFNVTAYAQADPVTIRDRALCILFERAYYGPSSLDEGSIGYVGDVENILTWGWIDGEKIDWRSPDLNGEVIFQVDNTGFWLDHISAFPAGVKDTATTPNKWTKFDGLTVQKAWYHWLKWRSTAHRLIDVFNINDPERRISRLEAPGNQTIWQQLIQMADKSILAMPFADRYGRLFLQVEQSLVPMAQRSSFPTVITLTTEDWQGDINFDRVKNKPLSLLNLSGVWWDGVTPTPIFSLSPGRVYGKEGVPDGRDRLALAGSDVADAQVTSNELSGAFFAKQNSDYPRIPIKLASNMRLLDFAPYQRVVVPIAASDTPRGIAENITCDPISINYVHDPVSMFLTTEIELEQETTPGLGITGDTPKVPPPYPPPPPPPPPILPPTPLPVGNAREVWMYVPQVGVVWAKDFFAGGQPTWNTIDYPADATATRVNFPISGSEQTHNQAATLQVSRDGSLVVLFGLMVSGHFGWWVLTNAAAVRANPATAPTWSLIAEANVTAFGSYTIGNTIPYMRIIGNTLYVEVRFNNGTTPMAYLTYTIAGGWTYHAQIVAHSQIAMYVTGGYYWNNESGATVSHGDQFNLRNGLTDVLFDGTHTDVMSGSYVDDLWRRDDSAVSIYTVYQHTDKNSTDGLASHYYLRKMSAGSSTNAHDFGLAAYPFTLRGAWKGPQLYAVEDNGDSYLSDDGTNFSLLDSWGDGWIHDAKLTGGGSLVWCRKNVASSNVPIRLYTRAGVPTDMTGNFWSLSGMGSGARKIYNMQLVYV